MRVVIQRVSEASVKVKGTTVGKIEQGLLILLGVEEKDENEDAQWLANKVVNMRIFSDEIGKLNQNIQEVKGEILVVSQFTLHAKTKKGNRPSFIHAAQPEKAISLYEGFIKVLETKIQKIETGIFGENMQVKLVNDGPVTIFIDTKNKE